MKNYAHAEIFAYIVQCDSLYVNIICVLSQGAADRRRVPDRAPARAGPLRAHLHVHTLRQAGTPAHHHQPHDLLLASLQLSGTVTTVLALGEGVLLLWKQNSTLRYA